MEEFLAPYIPEASLHLATSWWKELGFQLRISKARRSKLGDFRPAFKGKKSKISVNGDLGKYHFLITYTHEVAHAYTWNKYGRKVKPHGAEWKQLYAELLGQLVDIKVFPDEIKQELEQHLSRPKASSCSDPKLYKKLKSIEGHQDLTFLEEIAEGSRFTIGKKRAFIKGKKRRSRYECRELNTNRLYYVSGHAELELITN